MSDLIIEILEFYEEGFTVSEISNMLCVDRDEVEKIVEKSSSEFQKLCYNEIQEIDFSDVPY